MACLWGTTQSSGLEEKQATEKIELRFCFRDVPHYSASSSCLRSAGLALGLIFFLLSLRR